MAKWDKTYEYILANVIKNQDLKNAGNNIKLN